MSALSLPRSIREPETICSIPLVRAQRVGRASCSVLLTGATGTGKGYFARWLHDEGPRAGRSFVPVNCGALPESLIDSQLFGHVRGSFSDAHADHTGLVRAAEGGTLFLDEVADLPHAAQLRLLRLLEEKEVQPVGAMVPSRVDVRIIAATNQDLEAEVASGRFRTDLYYRLNVVRLELQPLAGRRHEIAHLVRTLSQELAAQIGRAPLRFTIAARRLLLTNLWRGNVRELRSVLERLYVLAGDDRVTPDMLAGFGQLATSQPSMAPVDPRIIAAREHLKHSGGNVSAAARDLGVHRSTVHRWLRRESA